MKKKQRDTRVERHESIVIYELIFIKLYFVS